MSSIKQQVVEGQVLLSIDLTKSFASEQPGSGFCFRLDLSGYGLVNGEKHETYFNGSNMGTSECLEDFAKNAVKHLYGFDIKRSMFDEDFVETVKEYFGEDEPVTVKQLLVALLSGEADTDDALDVGGTYELRLKDGKLELVQLSHSGENYIGEDEHEEEEDEDENDFEFSEDEEEESNAV